MQKEFEESIYFHISDTCGSTNDLAKKAARAREPEGSVFFTLNQTGGRGRLGRFWYAKPGENISMTLLLYPEILPEHLSVFPFFTALLIKKQLKALADIDISLKWPNDLLNKSGGSKLGGILMESSINADKVSYLLVGIGINVKNKDFPPDMNLNPTSLYLESGKLYSPEDLARSLAKAYMSRYRDFMDNYRKDSSAGKKTVARIMDEYRQNCITLGKKIKVKYKDLWIEAHARDITPGGNLILVDENKKKFEIASGDIYANENRQSHEFL